MFLAPGHALRRTRVARRGAYARLCRRYRALRDLRKANAPITVAAVAARAGVSRKTIYKHTDVIATIDQYRGARAPNSAAETTSREAAIVAALRRKIAACEVENKQLRSVIADQKQTIEMLYGELDR